MTDNNLSQLVAKLSGNVIEKATAKSSFTRMMVQLSREPLQYEDNDLLDYALTKIPIEQFYEAASEKSEADDTWDEQDYVAQEMVK